MNIVSLVHKKNSILVEVLSNTRNRRIYCIYVRPFFFMNTYQKKSEPFKKWGKNLWQFSALKKIGSLGSCDLNLIIMRIPEKFQRSSIHSPISSPFQVPTSFHFA